MDMVRPKQGTVKSGDRSEAIIIARMTEVGYIVLKPLSGQYRYDLVIEDADGHFWRIQCKTGLTMVIRSSSLMSLAVVIITRAENRSEKTRLSWTDRFFCGVLL